MAHLPARGDIIGRKYRIASQLGAGGMGVVFEATNIDTEGWVALKWLNPQLSSSHEAKERFKREAKVTARIQHPNVVAVHDCGEDDGQLYLVMELLRGKSLRERLTREPMELEEVCRIMLPVIRGVSAAHAAGVLHRDLKPENIFLCDSPDGLDPVPKVLDFGIAKLNTEATDETALSAHSALMGTYQYMAPEQLRRRRDLDARVDVYAIGVVLFRMLTGELPYDAHNPVDLALQVLQSDAPLVTTLVPSLPEALADVIARALARDRDQRFANMGQLAVALEPFAGGLRYRGGPSAVAGAPSVTARPSERVASPLPTPFVSTLAERKNSSRKKWGIAAGVLAMASGAVWFGVERVQGPAVNDPPVALEQPAPAKVRPASQEVPPIATTQAPLAPPAQAPIAKTPEEEWDDPSLQVPEADAKDQPLQVDPARKAPEGAKNGAPEADRGPEGPKPLKVRSAPRKHAQAESQRSPSEDDKAIQGQVEQGRAPGRSGASVSLDEFK